MLVYFLICKMYICKSVLMSFRCCVFSVDSWSSVSQLWSWHRPEEHSCLYYCHNSCTVSIYAYLFSMVKCNCLLWTMGFKLFHAVCAENWFDLWLLIYSHFFLSFPLFINFFFFSYLFLHSMTRHISGMCENIFVWTWNITFFGLKLKPMP